MLGFFQKCNHVLWDLLDMEVSIPKRVKLHNPGLNILHKSLVVCVVVVSILRFFFLKQWTSMLKDAHVSVTIRGEGPTLREMRLNPLCDEASHGDTRASATCLPVCGASTRADATQDPTCMSRLELMALHSTPRDFLIVTGVVDTSIVSDDEISQKFFLTPFDEDMELRFDYVVTLPSHHSGVHGVTPELADATSDGQIVQLTTAQSVSTRLLRQDGSIVALYQDGEPMRLTLSEILALAGRPNFLQSGAGSMPTGHFTGVQVELRVDCMLSLNDMKPTCDAHFHSELREAPDRSRLMPDRGIRSYYGVHVQAQGQCSYSVLDMNRLWDAFISFMVFVLIPRQVVGVVARFFLGHTSKIYNRVIVEEFLVRETMIGLILRVMIGKGCFAGIAGDDGVIDAGELVDALHTVFGDHSEISNALAAMATHCWRGIVAKQEDRSRITLQSFNAALIAQETVRLEDMMRIFSGQHKMMFLERLFLPQAMKRVTDLAFTDFLREDGRGQTFNAISLAVRRSETTDGHDSGMPSEHVRVGAEAEPDMEMAPIEPTNPDLDRMGQTAPNSASSSGPCVATLRQLDTRLKQVEHQMQQFWQSRSEFQTVPERDIRVEPEREILVEPEADMSPDIPAHVHSCTGGTEAQLILPDRRFLPTRRDVMDSQPCSGPVVAAEGGRPETSAGDDVNVSMTSDLEGRENHQDEEVPSCQQIPARVASLEKKLHNVSQDIWADIWKLWLTIDRLKLSDAGSSEFERQ